MTMAAWRHPPWSLRTAAPLDGHLDRSHGGAGRRHRWDDIRADRGASLPERVEERRRVVRRIDAGAYLVEHGQGMAMTVLGDPVVLCGRAVAPPGVETPGGVQRRDEFEPEARPVGWLTVLVGERDEVNELVARHPDR